MKNLRAYSVYRAEHAAIIYICTLLCSQVKGQKIILMRIG